MTTLFLVRELVCLLFLAVLARGDFRRLKIRNRLVLAGALCGTGLAALAGPAAAGSALGGGLTALALGFLLWRLSAFGAGDAKLLGMLGCFCGFAPLWQHLAAALLAAGAAVPPEQALPLYIRDKVAQTSAERAAARAGR